MSCHPDKIKNPAKMQLSYLPFATLNVVELNKERPGHQAGSFAIKAGKTRICCVHPPVNSAGTPPPLTAFSPTKRLAILGKNHDRR
jgi:hypothetical protein